MPIYDFECKKCRNKFDAIAGLESKSKVCKCGYLAKRVFPKSAPSINLKYNPKSDICDWDGNTSQYYRAYNEAKERGENVRLPEAGE